MQDWLNAIGRAVDALPERGERALIAIAGPPAAGKSTLAEAVVHALTKSGKPCGFLPMDGFHLDNETLAARGLLARKGAPETFDLEGFAACVAAVKTQNRIAIPLFDRDSDRVIAGAAHITENQRHVVVEGNYLLLDAPGWRELSQNWDVAVFLEVETDELTRRLIERWTHYGHSPQDARSRAAQNDLPNGHRVLTELQEKKITLRLSA